MRYQEFRDHLRRAGLSGAEFCRLLKKNPATASNYAKSGVVPGHFAVAVVLMAELAERGIDFRGPLERAQLTPYRPRGGRQFGAE